MNIYSVLYNDDAHLRKYGKLKVVHHPVEMDSNDSILIIHGGADISPSIYKHPVSKYTMATNKPSARDITELICVEKAIKMGIPIFGICRGAQLLCAIAGGSLIQHTNGHTSGIHEVTTVDKQTIKTTSCHHQMLNLQETEHELLGWASPSRSSVYIEKNDLSTKLEKEPEIVLFPKIKALAVQGHPEWMPENSSLVKYCHNIIERNLLK